MSKTVKIRLLVKPISNERLKIETTMQNGNTTKNKIQTVRMK